MVAHNSTRGNSSKKQHKKLVAILINDMYFFKNRGIKSVGFLSKTKQPENIHASKSQWIKYIPIVFLWEQNVWQKEVLLIHAQKMTFIILWKKNWYKWKLKYYSKTFLNQWEPIGSRKLQTKKLWEIFHSKSEIRTYEQDIIYKLRAYSRK